MDHQRGFLQQKIVTRAEIPSQALRDENESKLEAFI